LFIFSNNQLLKIYSQTNKVFTPKKKKNKKRGRVKGKVGIPPNPGINPTVSSGAAICTVGVEILAWHA
jgi:hypothetical protein